ncbi:uncharacterized protein LOC116295938, partial [Actinia tenebrosa]|uniref:Uncharacterized protein LOC116295938 n=1 Tax=Actinia tenebrosa TaxID=6105 RepID=A0A6P8I4N0_ACTTE
MCDNGTFVRTAPGRRKEDCKPCPEGTKNDGFAGFRACGCQDEFYRLDRFDKCYPCPDSGVRCFNESMTLEAGYYWQWISKSEKDYYINFTNNLQIFDDSYDRDLVQFNGSFPKHYQCPRSESCLGGLDAECAEGYTGPLCAVCDKKHYQLIATCFKCPAVHWLIFQICAILLVVVIIIYVVFKGKQRKAGAKRSLTDIILARLKIIVSFYQISSGTLDAFSYVQWPSALTKMSEYAKFVQLNILQIAPLHCFNSRLKMDAYADLVITCSMTAGVILVALAYYHLKRVYLSKRAGKSSIQTDLDATKEACYRNVFLFIFVTYPQTCSKIFQMLPASCHKICQDSSEQQCSSYLKADYSITCFTDKYNQYVILAYAALIYPFAVPLLTVAVLWKYYHKKTLQEAANVALSDEELRSNTKESEKRTRSVDERKQVIKTDSKMCQNTNISKKENHVIKKGDEHLEVISEEQDTIAVANETASPKKTPNSRHIRFMGGEVKHDQLQPVGNYPDENKMSRDEKRPRRQPLSLSKAVRAISETKKVFSNQKGSTSEKKGRRLGRSVVATVPIVAGMSFIFENYADNCWFWETIEMTRKLLLTSSLALIGAEGRNSLGVASMLSGCYAILHAHFMPIPDKFEHALQLTSLLVTFANTCIGMMLKIDQGALLDADAKIMDSLIITVLLVTANVMVTALVVVKYSVAVGQSIYYLIKNPRCSLSCCLSIMLTIDEVQSEARSMASNSGWKTKNLVKPSNDFQVSGVRDAAGEYGLTEVDMNDGGESNEDQEGDEEEKINDEDE